MQVCTSLQTDNHASTPPLSFLQALIPPQLAEIGNDFPAQRTWLSCVLLLAQLPCLHPALLYGRMILIAHCSKDCYWQVLGLCRAFIAQEQHGFDTVAYAQMGPPGGITRLGPESDIS